MPLSSSETVRELFATFRRALDEIQLDTNHPATASLGLNQMLWLSFGIAFGSDCKMTGRGSNVDSNLNFDQQDVKVLSVQKPLNILCEVWILFKYVEDAKIEASEVTVSSLKPQTAILYTVSALSSSRQDPEVWQKRMPGWNLEGKKLMQYHSGFQCQLTWPSWGCEMYDGSTVQE